MPSRAAHPRNLRPYTRIDTNVQWRRRRVEPTLAAQ
jgi:hypothetical protein